MDISWSYLSQLPFEPIADFYRNAGSRHFWLYVCTGVAIAAAAHRLSGDRRDFMQVFFARDAWLSRSARNDYAIILLNPFFRFTVLAWFVAHLNLIKDGVIHLLHAAGLRGEANDQTALLAGLGLTVALYIVNDFMRWLLHYLQHRIPLLWELHKVHHSAEHLNFATAERHHPLDILFFSGGMAIAMALVNGVFIGFFGASLTVATVFGANALWFASNIIGGVLRHSPAWVSYGPRVERWLISPAMHHIHHSADPRHFDKNMGGSLAIWDRMFGTLYVPNGREVTAFGLGEENRDYQSLFALYWRPVKMAAQRFAPARGARARP